MKIYYSHITAPEDFPDPVVIDAEALVRAAAHLIEVWNQNDHLARELVGTQFDPRTRLPDRLCLAEIMGMYRKNIKE